MDAILRKKVMREGWLVHCLFFFFLEGETMKEKEIRVSVVSFRKWLLSVARVRRRDESSTLMYLSIWQK
jgi:hypothetical protein